MFETRLGPLLFVVVLAAVFLALPNVQAEESPAPPASEAERQERLQTLEEKVKILTEEIQSLKTKAVVPETAAEMTSEKGLGPAASKIYRAAQGLSIGGYGEALLTKYVHDKGTNKDFADLERFVLYTGYKFTDRILFNSEIELEHAKTEATVSSPSGTAEVEFAYLDFRLWEPVNARAGLMLVPMGFLNEVHEPPFFFGATRPEVETRIIPTTWRELGAGIYGTLLPGLVYRTYAVNSLNAKGFTSSSLRDATSEGNRALAEDLAWTGRLDYTPFLGLTLGASFFWGKTGQGQRFAGRTIDPAFLLYDLHAQLEYRGLHLRGLFTEGTIEDARILSLDQGRPISHIIWGAYGEIAYDIVPILFPGTRQSLSPFVRIEWLDTQADVASGFQPDRSQRVQVNAFGVSYKPIPNVVFKFDYRQFRPASGKIADAVNVGMGFAF